MLLPEALREGAIETKQIPFIAERCRIDCAMYEQMEQALAPPDARGMDRVVLEEWKLVRLYSVIALLRTYGRHIRCPMRLLA